jgi:hypothetical protein
MNSPGDGAAGEPAGPPGGGACSDPVFDAVWRLIVGLHQVVEVQDSMWRAWVAAVRSLVEHVIEGQAARSDVVDDLSITSVKAKGSLVLVADDAEAPRSASSLLT